MEDSFYMCVAVSNNPYEEFPIQSRYFFGNFREALRSARNNAIVAFLAYEPDNYLYFNEIFVDIFKIPFGVDTFTGDDFLTISREFGDYYLDTVRDVKIQAIKTIQKYYRIYFKRKMDSVIFLQFALRKAIANPYTQLCRKRLLREFNELVTII